MSNVIALEASSNNPINQWDANANQTYRNEEYYTDFKVTHGITFYLRMAFEAVVFGGSLASILILLILLGEL